MDIKELFAKLAKHKCEGVLFHNCLADYFDFLSYTGFKCMQEYRFICESLELRKLHQYFIEHFNMLIPYSDIEHDSPIPKAWNDFTRQEVDIDARRNAVIDCFDKWVEWEKKTKEVLEDCFVELTNMGEIAAAEWVGECITSQAKELKVAEKMQLKLMTVNYDHDCMFSIQDELYEKFKEKIHELGEEL